MLKRFIQMAASAVILIIIMPAYAEGNRGCVRNFYQTHDMSCVEEVIDKMEKSNNPSVATNQSGVGMMAALFNKFPDRKEKFLSRAKSPYLKILYMQALQRAGLAFDAEIYAVKNKLDKLYIIYMAKHPAPLKNLIAVTAEDNDLLLGAYMVSGNTQYIQNILAPLKEANDAMASDAIRMAFLKAKFGPDVFPKDRKTEGIMPLCKKYDCKKDPKEFIRLATLSSGIWAIQTFAKKDENIEKVESDFFIKDKRLGMIFYKESVWFGNYLTLLTASSFAQNDATIEPLLSKYEKFESMPDKIIPAKK